MNNAGASGWWALSRGAWVVLCAFAAAAALDVSGADHAHTGHPPQTTMQGVVSLDVYRDGDTLHLLTGENGTNEAAPAVIYRRSDDSGMTWSIPVRVDQGMVASYGGRRGNDYQVAASGKRVVAVWMTRGSGWGGSGPLATARSSDGGKTWRAGANPAGDGSTAGQSFAEIIANRGSFHIVWLDSRDKNQGLRYARSTDGEKTWTPSTTLDAQTCECCWNSLLTTESGIYALYRDKSPRDMVLLNSPDGGKSWHTMATVGTFNWQIDACPETGGALAMTPAKILHAMIWTGREDAVGLYHLVSADQGRKWAAPRRVGGEMARHADMAVAPSGVIVAAWDELIRGEWMIMASVSSADGSSWSVPRRLSDSRSQATHPRVVTTRRGFRVFWTEQEKDQPRVWKSMAL